MYRSGRGVNVEDEEALEWQKKALEHYEMAARQGNAQAQFALGRIYENAWGVHRNNKTAVDADLVGFLYFGIGFADRFSIDGHGSAADEFLALPAAVR